MDFDTKVRGKTQLVEWRDIVKKDPTALDEAHPQVIKDFTLQYDNAVVISNPKDLVTKEYVDAGSNIGIPTDGTYTDGLIDLTPDTKISDATDDINEVLAELAPADASTLDNQDLAIYGGSTQKITGYLSFSQTATYKEAAGTQVSNIIKDATFTLETPTTTTRINKGDQGTLNVYINNALVDTFDLGASFSELNRATAQVYTPVTSTNGFITIVDVSKYNNFKRWQKCIARVNITPSALVEGYNKIKLTHAVATVQSSKDFEVFYDTDSTTPALSSYSVSLTPIVSTKYLSGIRFFGLSDSIVIGITGTNIFRNVYLQTNPVSFSGFCGIATGNIPITDGAVSGVSTPPVITDIMTVTGKVLSVTVANQCTTNARLSVTPRDPYGSYTTLQSPSNNVMVSTFSDGINGQSSDTTDYFSDEYYRLPLSFDFSSATAAITGQWDSTAALSSGNAQCFIISDNVHGLKYPQINFSSYLPAGANYSAFTGNQSYARCFVSSMSRTNTQIILGGISGGISQVGSGDINVEVKLPTQTAWLDCAKPYSSADGVAVDGNGCLSGSISYGGNATINVTFGGKATIDSNMRMYIRVTLRNSNRSVTSITTAGF